jgi:hypothetical protein
MSIDTAACVGISATVLLVAQVIDPITVFPQWLQVGGAGAAVAGVIWFLYYTTAVIQPRMQDKHSETIEKIVTEHRGAVKEMSDTLRVEMAAERVHHAATCEKIVAGIDQHISRLECQQTRRQ